MARQIAAGIDIGTFQIKVIIAEEIADSDGRRIPKIIGAGTAETRGVERGYIIDPAETAKSIHTALNKAEKMAGERVKRAYFSTGGVGLSSITANGSVIIARADLEVVDKDLETTLEIAESNIPSSALLNRKIINSIPLEYKIDGKPVWGRVEGLKAQKLEVKALFLTAMEHHLQDTIKVAELSGVEVIDVVAAPVAASFVTLSKRQKKAGVVLVDIGAETLSLVVFENDNLISLEVFPIGGADITNDLALGLRISPEDAEQLKHGAVLGAPYPKRKIDDIIARRISDMFKLVEAHLKKIGKDELLPAGIILTGGGSSIQTAADLAKAVLRLPSRTAPLAEGAQKMQLRDSSWSVAYGLTIWGFDGGRDMEADDRSTVGDFFKNLWRWFKKFLP